MRVNACLVTLYIIHSALLFLNISYEGVALDKHNVYGWLYLAKAQLATKDHKEAYKSSMKGKKLSLNILSKRFKIMQFEF